MGILQSRLLRQGMVRSILAANTFAPRSDNRVLTVPSFFSSWMTGEAGPAVLGIWGFRTAAAVRKARRGGGLTSADYIGLGLTAGASAALVKSILSHHRAEDALRAAVSRVVPESAIDDRLGTSRISRVVPFFTGAGQRRITRGVQYANIDGVSLKLDVYEPTVPPARGQLRPAIMQIHGGGWMVGDKREQGIPLLNYMAANGWVGFNVNYRLSPKVKSPVHLQDCKRALVWIREHAEEYNVDPNFIAVTGGSAGGHLAAMVALTENDPEFQPGFEGSDTSIQAGVPFYGVYDMLTRGGDEDQEFVDLMSQFVMAGDPESDPDSWSAYSPIDQVHTQAPPMMVIHGTKDVLVPVRGARRFVAKMTEFSDNPVVYAEIEGAQHAFDVFPSIRTNHTIEYVERFLNEMYQRYLDSGDFAEASQSTTA